MIKLTVMACKSALFLRSISAFGTPQKVFLIRLRVATLTSGFVLTIFERCKNYSLSGYTHKPVTKITPDRHTIITD